MFDTSGSMDGEKVSQAKAAATYVLDHLGEGDRFNIVSFNTATRLFAEKPVSLSRRGEGREFVKRLTAQGSTDINRALLEAVAGADKERPTVVIFMTDGLPTVGEKNPDRIVANVTSSAPKSVRLFAFGVGSDVDTVLLDQLSSSLRGTSAYVRPGQKIDEEVSGFYAKVSSPVLTDVKLDVQGVRVEELYPYPLPDLFAGNQLVIAGRYRQGGPATIRLSGLVNGQPQSYTYNGTFAARGGDDFIARLWAQRKIGYLLAQIRLSGAKDELVKEVVALSTRYGIVTPYTSFLVQEPQLALTQSGRDQLSRSAVAPAPTSASRRLRRAAAAGPLAAAERSGEKAVDRAVVESQLKASEQAAAPSVQQLRQVGDKTFLFSQNAWLDTAFDASKMQAEAIVFGSDRYFQLLGQYPEIGRYLALGDRVTVMLNGKAYAIGGEGQTAAQPAAQPGAQPGQAASPSPAPAQAATKLAPQPTPIPQLQTEGTPIVAGQPNGTPATDGQAAPPVCAGTGMIGLVGAAPAGVGLASARDLKRAGAITSRVRPCTAAHLRAIRGFILATLGMSCASCTIGAMPKLYDAYIFDLDGTVYLGDALLPTAGHTITTLRALGRRTVFLSNNPAHTRGLCPEADAPGIAHAALGCHQLVAGDGGFLAPAYARGASVRGGGEGAVRCAWKPPVSS